MDYTFDAETYAASYGTGSEVKSLFADADVNRYEGSGDNPSSITPAATGAGTVTSGPCS